MQDMVVVVCREIGQDTGRPINLQMGPIHAAHGDYAAIRQLWVNLVSNAVKYSRLKEDTRIVINSVIKDGEIIYSIRDNGVGFDMCYAEKLFTVFQRLHTEENFEGTGIGLAIVHRIVTKHGGRVWAEATVGVGATFYFSLPLPPDTSIPAAA
jgi:light-regulated signal transduction histidine kinase (bacteriophytochrome)